MDTEITIQIIDLWLHKIVIGCHVGHVGLDAADIGWHIGHIRCQAGDIRLEGCNIGLKLILSTRESL